MSANLGVYERSLSMLLGRWWRGPQGSPMPCW